MILVDTNIPARIAQPGHPHFHPAIDAIKLLTVRDSETFSISTHSLYELYFVMTKVKNGFGYSAARAAAELGNIRTMFPLLIETNNTYNTWESLTAKYAVTGRPAYDAKLVATMIERQVPRLLTFNDQDFAVYTEITALNPFDVLGLPRI